MKRRPRCGYPVDICIRRSSSYRASTEKRLRNTCGLGHWPPPMLALRTPDEVLAALPTESTKKKRAVDDPQEAALISKCLDGIFFSFPLSEYM